MDLHEIPEVRRNVGAVTYRELTAGLVWPHMLRALSISLNPKLWLMGFVCALGLFGGGYALDQLVQSIWDTEVTPFTPLGAFWPTGGRIDFTERMLALAVTLDQSPGWWNAVLAIWALPWIALGSVSVGRAAALEFAVSKAPAIAENFKYAASRWMSGLIAFGVPILMLTILHIVLWILGSLFFAADWLAMFGGIGYAIAIILGLKIAVLTLLILTCGTMLGSAIAIEDTDGVDAIQRSYAYVVNRPINLISYALLLTVSLFIGYTILQFMFRFGLNVASTVSGASEYLSNTEEPSSIAQDGIAFWVQATWLVFIGWVLSFLWTGGALLYLGMRRVHDEIDLFEVASEHPRKQFVRPTQTDDDQNTSSDL